MSFHYNYNDNYYNGIQEFHCNVSQLIVLDNSVVGEPANI